MRIQLRADRIGAPTFPIALTAALITTFAAAPTHASHLLGYGFNENGTSAAADGSASTAGNPALNLIGNSRRTG